MYLSGCKYIDGDVAHQVEQRIENPCVVGSSPTIATKHAPLDKSGKVASLKRKSSLGSTPRGGTNNLTNNGVCHIIEYGTLTQRKSLGLRNQRSGVQIPHVPPTGT